MRSFLLGLGVLAALTLALAPPAAAHPAESKCMSTTFLGELCPEKVLVGLGDDSLAEVQQGEVASDELRLISNTPKSSTLKSTNSDLAFSGDYAFAGNYDGFTIWDISEPTPTVVSETVCPGSQNDISVYGNLVVTSTDSGRNTSACAGNTTATTDQTLLGNAWEGLRIFDWSDPEKPTLVTTVKTKCGSHTHTLVPELGKNRLLAYVSSYSPGANLNCTVPHDLISVVEIPLGNPAAAKVIGEPVLFPLIPGEGGGKPGGESGTSGCHDITAYPEIGLAAGACMGEGILLDIKDPANPKKLSTMTDSNFAFWHSATFSNDGTKVIFTDELGGGSAARCTSAYGPDKGADGFYDISDPKAPKFVSYFKIPRFQMTTENCVSHNGSLLPHPTRDLFVQAWYQGGTSVIDFTDAKNPTEVAFFDRGPVNEASLVSGGHWSSYWYNGRIYGNEIARGFDVLEYSDDKTTFRYDHFNAQTQQRVG